MTQPLLVGLDVGTTASKAVVFTPSGQPVADGRAATPWQATASGAELDPRGLLDAALRAVGDALAAAPDGPVVALGVASIGESGVLVDGAGEPVAPVIAWHDTRDEQQVRELARDLGAAEFGVRTGLPLRGQWSLTKQRWLVRHWPATRTATRRFSVAEWIVRALGGEEASEQSLASRTGWLDLSARRWWPEALEWSGISPSLLPDLVASGDPLGRAGAAGVPPRLAGAVLTVAGQDHQAASVGAGAAGPGDLLDSCGTAEALIRTVPPGLPAAAVRQLVDAGITVGWHALPGLWCLLGATEGGLVLDRTLRLLGLTSAAIADLDARALSAGPARLRLDIGRDAVTIADVGADASPGALWRAATEAVTRQAAELLAVMTEVAGVHRRMVVTGGWARSSALLAAKSKSFGPMARPRPGEAGARGAALLAGLAAGVFASVDELPAPEPALRTGQQPAPYTSEVSRV
ncbi:MAG TPA: FGGY family carbohydrate kinase [Trebonia sp.]|nr:FGGY family carbohydrate kinase [Trebonia sp.]